MSQNNRLRDLAQWFMPAAGAPPMRLESRIDLVPAASPPSFGADQFIVLKYAPPKGQALVVQSIVGYLEQRINIGGPAGVPETTILLTNQQAAGKILFTPMVNDQSAFQSEIIQNPSAVLAFATNRPPLRSSGWTSVSENPDTDLFANWFNPLFSFVVRSQQQFQVLFKVLPVAAGIGVGSGTLAITDDPNVIDRVDFASVLVGGQLVADSIFSDLDKE